MTAAEFCRKFIVAMGQCLENFKVSELIKTFLAFDEPGCSSPFSQKHVIVLYPEPV
jgi:hypothetical protein